MRKIVWIFFLVSTVTSASPFQTYFEEAGRQYNIPPLLLEKISHIESGGNPNAIRLNQNGSKDYGLMQINSIHFKKLRQWGINENNIMHPKINIFVGSWLLSEHIKERGFNLQAIGNYHSKTPVYKDKWLKRLCSALKKPGV